MILHPKTKVVSAFPALFLKVHGYCKSRKIKTTRVQSDGGRCNHDDLPFRKKLMDEICVSAFALVGNS
jgi:hypothetical protein